MSTAQRPWLAAALAGLCCWPALAQEKLPPPAPPPSTALLKPPHGNAATVNGQAITEKAIFRGLRRVPEERRVEARKEILNYLIDNVLIDQEMTRLKIAVEAREVDARIAQIKEEIKKDGKEFADVMKGLYLTEEELRNQIAADLRWDKYANQQATDKAVRELFDNNLAMFNGTLAHARHLLLTPPQDTAESAQATKAKLVAIRKRIEDQVAEGLAKLPATADKAKRDEERNKLLDKAFAEAASRESACPSKKQGGDLGWFPRAGKMVEPFARAAFALKPYEMSEVVTTPFGHHLILLLAIKPGQPVKFEEAREVVKDVYCDRLRDDLIARLRPAANIVMTPARKP